MTVRSQQRHWVVKLAAASGIALEQSDGPAELCARLLLASRLLPLEREITALRAESPSPWLDLLKAECRSRRHDRALFAELADIRAALVAQNAPPVLARWLQALIADHMVFLGWLEGMSLTARPLESAPTPESTLDRLSRLRLTRAESILGTFVRDQREGSLAALGRISFEFAEAGSPAESSLTQCAAATAAAIQSQPRVETSLITVMKAARKVETCESDRTDLALLCVAGVAHLAEDDAIVRQYAGRLAAASPSETARVISSYAIAFADVCEQASEQALDELTARFSALIEHYPQPWAIVSEAMNLFDYGRSEPSVRAVTLARATPVITGQTKEGLAILRARQEFLDTGGERALGKLRELAEHFVAADNPDQAAILLLRTARDCQLCGRRGDTALLISEALAVVGCVASEGEQRTRMGELDSLANKTRRVLEIAQNATNRAEGSATLTLLGPDVKVALAPSGPVRITPLAAHVLAILGASKSPVPTEALLQAVWPDLDVSIARRRLNLTIHRLRTTLGLGREGLVIRTAHDLTLDAGNWRIDAAEFRELAKSPRVSSRRRAFDSYQANLCSNQFLFDDLIADLREELMMLWADLAIGLVRDEAIDAAFVRSRADELGVDYPRLLRALG